MSSVLFNILQLGLPPQVNVGILSRKVDNSQLLFEIVALPKCLLQLAYPP